MGSPRVERLSVRCGVCHAPVRVRTAQEAFEALARAMERGELDPETVVMTYMCARKAPDNELCNTVVEIKVKHLKPVSL